MIGVKSQDLLGFQVEGESESGESEAESPLGSDFPRLSNQVAFLNLVTPVDSGGGSSSGNNSGGSGTWGRSGPPKKEELVGGKKKGRTWGPSSTLQKERAGGEERYWWVKPTLWLPPGPWPLEAHELHPHLWFPLQAEGPGGRKQTVVIKRPQPGQVPQTHTHRPRLRQPQ